MRLPPRRTWPSTPPVRSRHASVPPHPPPSSSSQGSNNLSYSHEHWHRLLFVFFLSDRMPVCLPLSLCFCHQATIVCRLSGSLSVLPPSLSLSSCVANAISVSTSLSVYFSLSMSFDIFFIVYTPSHYMWIFRRVLAWRRLPTRHRCSLAGQGTLAWFHDCIQQKDCLLDGFLFS